jgi:hypothetical protein
MRPCTCSTHVNGQMPKYSIYLHDIYQDKRHTDMPLIAHLKVPLRNERTFSNNFLQPHITHHHRKLYNSEVVKP